MKIYADDGREFKSVDECNAYESDLALKKQKEEVEIKARADKLKYINSVINKAKTLIDEYEQETGRKVVYTYDYSTGKIGLTDTRNTLDFAYENITDKLRRLGLI